MKHFQVQLVVADAIHNYLRSRPYAEVEALILGLKTGQIVEIEVPANDAAPVEAAPVEPAAAEAVAA